MVPSIMRAASEYQFDDEMESAISVFATLTKRDAKVRRALNTLTYEDVYWASKIENPMVKKPDIRECMGQRSQCTNQRLQYVGRLL